MCLIIYQPTKVEFYFSDLTFYKFVREHGMVYASYDVTRSNDGDEKGHGVCLL